MTHANSSSPACRPIVFTETMPMVLSGKKTQTRRVVKPQPKMFDDGSWPVHSEDASGKWFRPAGLQGDGTPYPLFDCPYGDAGDELWVREPWGILNLQTLELERGPLSGYKQTKECLLPEYHIVYKADSQHKEQKGWRSPRYLPKWASRVRLRVVSSGVEPLRRITEEDAKAEGVTCEPNEGIGNDGKYYAECSYRLGFAILWNNINGLRGYKWALDPFVWRVEFGRIES